MCDTGNLIDLTGWDEPQKEETILEESEASMVGTNSFKGPYDPFDSVEKEACIKGINLSTLQKVTEVAKATENPYPDLENESPPVCMQSDVVPGEGVRPPNRPTNSSFQKQLLKLNASRSVINTPPHHGSKSRGAAGSDSQFEKTILAENLQMIAAESPLKLIDDEPPADSNYRSSVNFEEDLKMLRIPILDAMTAKEEEPKTPEEGHKAHFQTLDNQPQFGHQSNTRKNVGHLLQELKTLVHDKVDITKRYHFDSVIEALDAALFGSSSIPSCAAAVAGDVDHTTPVTTLPHAYTRQGTFDLELKDKRTTSVDEQTPPATKMQEFPDAMVCSSATFDGDSRPELYDKDFHPMSAPPVPAPAPTPEAAAVPLKRESFMTELVDESLALQINELLERHNRSHNEHHGADPRTVILLVNPSNGGQFQTSCFVQPPAVDLQTGAKAIVANDDEGSMRRRSSSLSIHDKSKLLPERKANQLIENIQNVPPKEPRIMSSAGGPPPFRQRRNSFSIVNPPVKGAEAHNRRTILGSRMKTPSINESMSKCNGTAKASIPIKRVIPIVKPVNVAPNEGTYLNPVHPPETPMPVKPKAGQKIFCTSTPLPQMRSLQRRSLKPVSVNAVVNASYSTPNIRRASFSKKPGSG
ncbi:uncharacterized protein LOC117588405 isoform X2 [Drosophila guanche]|uniref:Uncharacterized protein n=1 Tax=Drosophila guanche TaxID=7266 RepID=A0A3B0KRQ0_DROGU|nr:uncharacterized protein LOC117588405 isoform X2 [Drosophila guanche]SPP86598.1 Hypothetical predicted protein [Drosophila guanche]